MNSHLRILHLAESIRGGVGTYLNNIVPEQIAMYGDDAVRVLVPEDHREIAADIPQRNVITYRRRGRNAIDFARLVGEIRNACRQYEPNVVHAHSTFAGAASRILFAGRGGSKKILYSPHGWAFYTQRPGFKKSAISGAERLLSNLCNRIVAVSQRELVDGLAIGINSSKLVLIRNGIPDNASPAQHIDWCDERLKVLFVGRLDRQKGCDVLLDAATGSEGLWTIRLIGDAVNGDGEPLRRPSNADFLGWQSAQLVAAHLASADVVVIPSRWEGLPLIALEAMRAAKPIIASDVGGNSEAIVDGETGFLFPSEDSSTLRERLLLLDVQRAKAMGEAGRDRFLAEFEMRQVVTELDKIYRSIAGI